MFTGFTFSRKTLTSAPWFKALPRTSRWVFLNQWTVADDDFMEMNAGTKLRPNISAGYRRELRKERANTRNGHNKKRGGTRDPK